MSVSIRSVFSWMVGLALLASTASAQRGDPGSLLLFPEFDSRVGLGSLCLITVTNSETDAGGASLETVWEYVNGPTCTSDPVVEPLNVADTITVFAGAHAPSPAWGYLFVYAIDPDDGQAIVHDHLIGTATILDGVGALEYTVEPLSFSGIGDGIHTDLDGDGARDLDGLEYSQVAERISVPRFLGQTTDLQSYLVMIDLSGGPGFDTVLGYLVHNDNEEVFSAEYAFSCWNKVPLSSISGIFDNDFLSNWTNHDPNEVLGAPTIESGWIEVDGLWSASTTQTIPGPAFACYLVDYRPTTDTMTSVHPIGHGKQDNGALLPNGEVDGPRGSR